MQRRKTSGLTTLEALAHYGTYTAQTKRGTAFLSYVRQHGWVFSDGRRSLDLGGSQDGMQEIFRRLNRDVTQLPQSWDLLDCTPHVPTADIVVTGRRRSQHAERPRKVQTFKPNGYLKRNTAPTPRAVGTAPIAKKPERWCDTYSGVCVLRFGRWVGNRRPTFR